MEMQLAANKFQDELERLQEEVDETTKSSQSAVMDTQESLNSKKVEKEGAQSRLSTVASELNGVKAEISDNKDHRKVVNVVRLRFSISITEASTDCWKGQIWRISSFAFLSPGAWSCRWHASGRHVSLFAS